MGKKTINMAVRVASNLKWILILIILALNPIFMLWFLEKSGRLNQVYVVTEGNFTRSKFVQKPFSRELLKPENPVPNMCFISQQVVNSEGLSDETPLSDIQKRTYPPSRRKDKCDNCFPYIYRTVIDTEDCANMPQVKMLTLITTTPRERAIRQAIRETWGIKSDNVKTIFLFGVGWSEKDQETLYLESKVYGDILQENYIDSYFNLSIKVLSGLNWWSRHCQQAPYILRSAGDTFNNVDGIINLMQSRLWPIGLIGKIPENSKPKRKPNSKFYITENDYPHAEFPTYCSGTTIVFTAETAKTILVTSPNVPYFVFEDVYLGLVMKAALPNSNHTAIHAKGFSHLAPPMKKRCSISSTQDLRPHWLSLHVVKNAEHMRWIDKFCPRILAAIHMGGFI